MTTPTLITPRPSDEANWSFIYYDFKVSTSSDGTGTVIDSGWLETNPNNTNSPGPMTWTV